MGAVAKGGAVLVFGVFCLGYGFGHAQGDKPDEVKVPVYKTKYVTETETVEVVKTEPLPKSCNDLPIYAAKVVEGNGVLDTAVADIQLALVELGRATQAADVPQINKATEVINKNRRIIDENTVTRSQASINLTNQLELCESGLK